MISVDKIKDRIQLMGLKNKHLASKIDVTPVMFSYFLNGKRQLSQEKYDILIKYLGL